MRRGFWACNFGLPSISLENVTAHGEFVGSGTVGFGCGAELNKWLKPGDVVELEGEGIGILRNRVERSV
jgi:2-keto-4-pentenoate hydratase/2-oxohepta-3-ene-1,7-dioic acid hydratase in catechol pathway